MNRRVGVIASASLAAGLGLLALPGASAAADGLRIALTALQPAGDVCAVTLLVDNRFTKALDRFSIDLFAFDTDGAPIDRTLLDMAPLPTGTSNVAVPMSVSCAGIARLLIHDIPTCRIEGISVMRDCHDGLETSTRLDVPLEKTVGS